MNVSTVRLLFLSFVIIPLCGVSHTSSPLEFKQAVARYIKHTDVHCLQHSQRHSDENMPYKKELRYLFKNYENMSISALLARLRSAHQEMMKHESDITSDSYKRYEQISSALLLICAQSFFYDARNQILNALDEIDHLILYWRYQQHHQISYFLSKSPTKWIMGKSQAKEIAHNVSLLERKQRELYRLLGALAGHAHALTICNITYDECYAWVSGLLTVLSHNHNPSSDGSHAIQFDDVAAQLALKMKKMDSLAHDLLRSLNSARKPSHFMQHWIAYTAMLAAAGYVAHYHINNPTVIPAAIGVAQGEAKRLFNLLINPFDKIYKRLKIALSGNDRVKKNDSGDFGIETYQNIEIKKDNLPEIYTVLDQIKTVSGQLDEGGKEFISNIAQQLAKSNTTLREDAVNIIQDGIKNAENSWIGYNFNAEALKADLQIIRNTKDPVIGGRVRASITQLCKDTYYTPQGMALWQKLSRGNLLLGLVEDYLDPLQEYAQIADKSIINKTVPLIDHEAALIAKLVELFGKEGISLVQDAKAQLENTEAQLKDQELTLMFAALIPLISTVSGTAYIYKWFTTKNYSPIRIALADVNSLLIESASKFDDYAYGKLLYLVFKLRRTVSTLKDPLAYEFLNDVAKLELKQYDSETKHSIVENMFNKYAFLGRIAA